MEDDLPVVDVISCIFRINERILLIKQNYKLATISDPS